MTLHFAIRDRYADDKMRARVETALTTFQAQHKLSSTEIVDIYKDSDHPLFDALDSALMAAAVEGFADRSYVIGEIEIWATP